MTRDEHRAKCIEAMAKQLWLYNEPGPDWKDYLGDATLAFDAIHGIARVLSPEATPEMIAAAWQTVNPCGENCIEKFGTGPAVREAYAVMAAAGDLTNPPERKP